MTSAEIDSGNRAGPRTGGRRDAVEVHAYRSHRLIWTGMLGVFTVLFAFSWGIRVGAGHPVHWGDLLQLPMFPYLWWLVYGLWRGPVLRLDADRIEWQPVGAWRALRVPVQDVTGYRAVAADLWLERREGPPSHVLLSGIGERDRARVRAWLDERWSGAA
jgi:hypothetical protein